MKPAHFEASAALQSEGYDDRLSNLRMMLAGRGLASSLGTNDELVWRRDAPASNYEGTGIDLFDEVRLRVEDEQLELTVETAAHKYRSRNLGILGYLLLACLSFLLVMILNFANPDTAKIAPQMVALFGPYLVGTPSLLWFAQRSEARTLANVEAAVNALARELAGKR